MKRVHAITVHHRGCQMLSECLGSVLSCGGIELEVVVVLNGCDEGLPEIVTSSAKVHTVVADPPQGFSAANNLGVAFARSQLGESDYYYFLNNDTVSEPDSLRMMVEALEDDPEAAVAGPQLLIQWAPDHLNSLGLNVTDDGWGWDEGIGVSLEAYGALPGRRRVVAVTGSALLMRCDVFQHIDGWTELYDYYFEDIDLCLKAQRVGWGVVHVPEAVVYHQVSATMTLESSHKVYLFWRNRILVSVVHWPWRRLLHQARVVVVDEILRRPRAETELQRRALRGALGKLGAALRVRRRLHGTSRKWLDLLRPRGSVPTITLPQRSHEPAHSPPHVEAESIALDHRDTTTGESMTMDTMADKAADASGAILTLEERLEIAERDAESLRSQLVDLEVRLAMTIGALSRAEADVAEARRQIEESQAGYHQVRSELGRIHQSRLWALWMAWHRTRRVVTAPFKRMRRRGI